MARLRGRAVDAADGHHLRAAGVRAGAGLPGRGAVRQGPRARPAEPPDGRADGHALARARPRRRAAGRRRRPDAGPRRRQHRAGPVERPGGHPAAGAGQRRRHARLAAGRALPPGGATGGQQCAGAIRAVPPRRAAGPARPIGHALGRSRPASRIPVGRRAAPTGRGEGRAGPHRRRRQGDRGGQARRPGHPRQPGAGADRPARRAGGRGQDRGGAVRHRRAGPRRPGAATVGRAEALGLRPRPDRADDPPDQRVARPGGAGVRGAGPVRAVGQGQGCADHQSRMPG